MTPWTERPPEVANLLNPAFLGTVLVAVVQGHQPVGGALPLTLAFLAAPVILHRPTRDALPNTTATSLAAWLQANPERLVGFADRARGLVPFVREGVAFATNAGALAVGSDLTLTNPQRSIPAARLKKLERDAKTCVSKASLVGKWFALAGDPATVYTLWGVRP